MGREEDLEEDGVDCVEEGMKIASMNEENAEYIMKRVKHSVRFNQEVEEEKEEEEEKGGEGKKEKGEDEREEGEEKREHEREKDG